MGLKKGTGTSSKKDITKGEDKNFYPIDKFKIEDRVADECEQLISYYRQFPFMCAKEYLEIELYDYQKLLLYELIHKNYFVFVGCRNIAKRSNNISIMARLY